MYYANYPSFFEIPSGPQMENSLSARWLCVKDFLKRIASLPLALLHRGCKTFFKGVGVVFGAFLVLVTVASSENARDFFIRRVVTFAKDFADWLLIPVVLLGSFLRLILALFIHPNLYFRGFF